MAQKENQFLKTLHEQNLVDDRDIALVAEVKSSNGMRGRAWFFLNGTNLYLYELRGLANYGECVEVLDLSQATMLKSNSFIFNRYMVLDCNGVIYRLWNFANAANAIEAVRQSCKA